MLIDKKYRLEPIVNPLENEKLQLMGFIEQKTISPEQIYDTQEFAKTISQEINFASCDLENKRRSIDLLDVQVYYTVDDEGGKLVRLKCALGDNQFGLSKNNDTHPSAAESTLRGLYKAIYISKALLWAGPFHQS
jgi:hypothetical protein